MHRLPEEEELEWAFGTSGKVDRAKYLCSLFLKNVVDVVQLLDEHFQLIRYAERLCTYLTTFEPLERELEKMSLTENISLTESTELTEKASLRLALGNGNMIEELMLELLEKKLQEVKQDLEDLYSKQAYLAMGGTSLEALENAELIKQTE